VAVMRQASNLPVTIGDCVIRSQEMLGCIKLSLHRLGQKMLGQSRCGVISGKNISQKMHNRKIIKKTD